MITNSKTICFIPSTRNLPNRHYGIAMAWMIIFMVLFVAIIGLATDTARIWLVAHKLQNAADGAAMAAAQLVKFDQEGARQAAINLASTVQIGEDPVQLNYNGSNDPEGDIVFGRYDRDTHTFTPNLDYTNAVKIVARRTETSLGGPVSLIFGSLFGVGESNVSRYAIAINAGVTGAGLIALDRNAECALNVWGNAILDVKGGDIQVNSASESGACFQGSVTIETPQLNVKGNVKIQGGANVTGDIVPNHPQILDPLKDLPDLSYDTSDDWGVINTAGTYSPGYYSGGINLTGNDVVNLEPGIYILDGIGLNIGGGTNFIAEGVMFYLVGAGAVEIGGTGLVRVTPPDPDVHTFPGADIYESVSFFQARDNLNDALIIGTSNLDLQGTIYFPSNHLSLGGTGDGFGNQLIVNTIDIFGDGEKSIEYDGRNPAPGTKSFIIE